MNHWRLATLLFLVLAHYAFGESRLLVTPTNTTWKYWATNTSMDRIWTTDQYEDLHWPEGPSPLGHLGHEIVLNGKNITNLGGTLIPRTPYQFSSLTTHYFRKIISWDPNDRRLVRLIFTNYVDDGIVMYLNGAELYRLRMPDGPIGHTTTANRNSELSTNPKGDAVVITTDLLRETNVFAAEVHQDRVGSEDSVFALNVVAYFVGNLIFTVNPLPANLTEDQTLMLSAAVDDPLATYQWFKEGHPIESATNSTLVISNVSLSASGNYYVVASNDYPSFAQSHSATVTVSPLEFTRQPTNTVVVATRNAYLYAEVNGPATFQWFYNDTEIDPFIIPSATSNRLVLENVTHEHSGTYYVVASNPFRNITSSTVFVEVADDNEPPKILRAYRSPLNGVIVVDFDEEILDAGFSPAMFQAQTYCEEPRQILALQLNPTNHCQLLLTPSHADVETVVGPEIQDLSGNAGPLAITINHGYPLIGRNDEWKFDVTATAAPLGWPTNFNSSGWATGLGPIGHENAILPWPLTTQLTNHSPFEPSRVSYYFSKSFFSWQFSGYVFLVHQIDDGAVFYLNGHEIGRGGMGSWPDEFGSFPPISVSNAELSIFEVNPTLLISGYNEIAVAVKNVPSSSDVVFGMELFMYPTNIVYDPFVSILNKPENKTIVEGTDVLLRVNASSACTNLHRYAWFFQNGFITGATNSTLLLTNVTYAQSGSYSVIVWGKHGLNDSGVIANLTAISSPLRFTVQPTNINLLAHGPDVRLVSEVNGPARFQWYKDGIEMDPVFYPNATNSTLILEDAGCSDEGSYYVIAFNSEGDIVQSESATFTLADCGFGIEPPAVLSAYLLPHTNLLVINFDNALGQTGINTQNIRGANICGEPITFLSVARNETNATQLVIEVPTNSGLYTISAESIQDLWGNATPFRTTFKSPVPLLLKNDVWRFNMTSTNTPPGWPANFDTGDWFIAAGPIGYEISPLPWPISSPLTNYGLYDGSRPSYYFSRQFLISPPIPDYLMLFAQIDDGAIFYINGQEVSRVRMGDYEDTFNSLAVAAVDARVEVFELKHPPLIQGSNQIAVTVKQVSGNNSDVVFGLEIFKFVHIVPVNPCIPDLQWTRNENQLHLFWNRSGFLLEQTSNLTALWDRVPSNQTNATVELSDGPRFFRLVTQP